MDDAIDIASESLEGAVLRALHDGAPSGTRAALGLRMEEIDGALVSIAGRDPSIVLNRTIRLGLAQPAGERTVRAVSDLYRQAGVQRFFLHVHPQAAPPNLREILTRAGLRPHRRWMKFERGAEAPPQAPSTLEVREIGADSVARFGAIVAPAFDLSPEASPLFSGLVGRPGVHLYMSFDGDQPAGAGLLYIQGDCAWFDWGATDPAFRGRGSQRAVLVRRIADAVAAGCTRLMTCTGEAVPGDPQHSYHNIEWAGFRATHLRENWVPA